MYLIKMKLVSSDTHKTNFASIFSYLNCWTIHLKSQMAVEVSEISISSVSTTRL